MSGHEQGHDTAYDRIMTPDEIDNVARDGYVAGWDAAERAMAATPPQEGGGTCPECLSIVPTVLDEHRSDTEDPCGGTGGRPACAVRNAAGVLCTELLGHDNGVHTPAAPQAEGEAASDSDVAQGLPVDVLIDVLADLAEAGGLTTDEVERLVAIRAATPAASAEGSPKEGEAASGDADAIAHALMVTDWSRLGLHLPSRPSLEQARRMAEVALAALRAATSTAQAAPDDLGGYGATLIAAERRRQIDAEGWTAGHDAKHTSGELVHAAGVYLHLLDEHEWPWRTTAPKYDPDGRRVPELVKAGALIAAQIDRLRGSFDDIPPAALAAGDVVETAAQLDARALVGTRVDGDTAILVEPGMWWITGHGAVHTPQLDFPVTVSGIPAATS